MSRRVRWYKPTVLLVALALSNGATGYGGEQRHNTVPNGEAARAQRSAAAQLVLEAKEEALGESFDPTIRASLKRRLEALPAGQLAGLAVDGALADIPAVLGDSGADLVYTPVVPCRVLDTRPGQGGTGPIAAGTQRNFEVAGTTGFEAQGGKSGGCGIPVGATSVIINFAVVGPAGAGNLRAWAVADPQPAAPLAAVMNYGVVTGLAALANGVAVPICDPSATSCAAGDLRLQADVNPVNVVGDVVGYFKRFDAAQVWQVIPFMGAIGTIPASGSDYVWAGPTVSVTPAAGQRLYVSAIANLGVGGGGSAIVTVDVCYSDGGSLIGTAPMDAVVGQYRELYPVVASFTPGAGVWDVGVCVLNTVTIPIAGNGLVSGWVQVSN